MLTIEKLKKEEAMIMGHSLILFKSKEMYTLTDEEREKFKPIFREAELQYL